MRHKPDIESVLERNQAFWECAPVERPMLGVVAWSDDYRPIDESGVDLLTRKTDIGYILEHAEQDFRNHCYLAEALPVYTPGLFCADTAAFFYPAQTNGVWQDIQIQENTVWYPQVVDDWDTFELRFDPGNRWWQLVRSMTEAAAPWAVDRCLLGIPDFQPGMDTLSLLRSSGKLCVDLFDNPEAVKQATDYIIDEVYPYCYDEVRAIMTRHATYVSDWMGLAYPQRHDIIQCDFVALISPRHFVEFCLPSIERQCRMLDASVYHLDGPTAVPHLDHLLEVKELNAIQWVPGEGKPPALAWLPMLKRVQAAGKGLVISSPPAEVPALVEELSPRGLLIDVRPRFDSVDEAKGFIDTVERACRQAHSHMRATA
jgi:hypothetical protein